MTLEGPEPATRRVRTASLTRRDALDTVGRPAVRGPRLDVVLESPESNPREAVAPAGAAVPGIERALYVGDRPFRVVATGPFDRVHAGWEFCAVRIGSEERARETVRAAVRQGAPVTLVTPPTRNLHLGAVMAAVDEFARLAPDGELVVNDWGVLHEARRAFPSLACTLGRMLFRMHRDPESPLLGRAAAGGSTAGLLPLDSPAFLRLVADFGISRVEADAVLPVLPVPPDRAGLPAVSLHAPYRYLGHTFSCRAAGLQRSGPPMPIDRCERECDGLEVRVRRGRGREPEIQVGNAVFLEGPSPVLPAGSGVDRLVVRRHPWV